MRLLQMVKMVLWGLIGIRSRSGSQADEQVFRPGHAIGVALVIVGVFLAILITLVQVAVNGAK